MTYIRCRRHDPGRYVALAALLAAPSLAATQMAHASDSDVTEVVVKGRATGYATERDSSPKHTESLLDTPQTLTVIKKEVLRDQAAAGLTDALRNTPGITLQLGENGSTSAGDTFQMRGFAAQTSVYLDGLHDLGAVSRDIFNMEQVEIAKGPAGSQAGRGAASGYVNLVSKLPELNGGSVATLMADSQGGSRETADGNIRTGKTSAFRLNLMAQDTGVAGRDLVRNRSTGIAPSFAAGLGTATRLSLFAQYVAQDNTPDGGIPTIGEEGFHNADPRLAAGARVDRRNFYGANSDREKSGTGLLSARLDHDFTGGLHLDNLLRYGRTTMRRVITGVNGLSAPSADPASWTVAPTRQRIDQENDVLADQLNLTKSLRAGKWTHDLAAGIEIGDEHQFAPAFTTTGMTIAAGNLYHPNPGDTLPDPAPAGAALDGRITTQSAWLFDTVKPGPHWLFSGGMRIDAYEVATRGTVVSTATSYPSLPAGSIVPVDLKTRGDIASWNLGVVYKPNADSSLYIAWGNAVTPPGSANLTLSATAGNIAGTAFKPTQTSSLEAGAKWSLSGGRLGLAAAWYATEAKDELAQLDTVTNTYAQLGRRRIDGIELSAVGQVTQGWQVSAGLQTLHTRIVQGTTGNTAAGAATRWSPDLTATVWTTARLGPRLSVGGGANYVSDQKLVVNPAINPATFAGIGKIPAYWVASAMASYDMSPHLTLQLNAQNLLNQRHIASLNNGGSRLIPGAPQSFVLSLIARL